MKHVLKTLFLLFAFLGSTPIYGQSIDYSSYELAKVYLQQKDIVMTYKFLLIFKYVNLKKLEEEQNKDALNLIDTKIKEAENILKQNTYWYDIKRSRGFSDKQLDSSIKNEAQKIILGPIIAK